jgi:hypothetical protein
MGAFDIERSLREAEGRFGRAARRRRRSDAGSSRLPAVVATRLRRLLHGRERPAMTEVQARLRRFCERRRLKPPSRATVYGFLSRCPPHRYVIAELPGYVRDALYNLGPDGPVPGHQLAFYAFQYGDMRAACFAAGLPWLDLWQANRMRGWRSRSHGLLRAVRRKRGIT